MKSFPGTWAAYLGTVGNHLQQLSIRNKAGEELMAQEGFEVWKNMARANSRNRAVIYLIGNGASASMASHFSADLAKNARLHTQVFSDLSLITAISNDLGYENVFLEPLKRRAKQGDMLIAISSSGESKNILLAAEYANSIGMDTVTLSGMNPGNALRKQGTVNLYVPGKTYGLVETCHAAILHYWMDFLSSSTSEGPLGK